MTFIKKSAVFFSILVFSGIMAYSQQFQPPGQTQQTPVSDEEIQQFATAMNSVQTANQQAQQEMVKAVTDEGIEVSRYNEIYQAQQNPDKDASSSEEEMEQFRSASQAIQKIQQETQKQIEEDIQEAGLTLQRYQEIATQVQGDTDLQEKIKEQMQQ